MVEVVRLFADDATAGEWCAAMSWPDGPQCPHCAARNVLSGAAHPSVPCCCRGFDKRFSVRTGSVMADSKLGYPVWAVAIHLLTTGLQGVSGMKLHRDLGILQKSARHPARAVPARIRNRQQRSRGPGCRLPAERQHRRRDEMMMTNPPAERRAPLDEGHPRQRKRRFAPKVIPFVPRE